jgi:hypothetical protein
MLKALEGHLPAPGASRARQAFWHQQLLFDYDVPMGAELRPSLNLLVLWETDAAYTLRRLSLVCPKVGGLTRESVAAYWTIEIECTRNEFRGKVARDGGLWVQGTLRPW